MGKKLYKFKKLPESKYWSTMKNGELPRFSGETARRRRPAIAPSLSGSSPSTKLSPNGPSCPRIILIPSISRSSNCRSRFPNLPFLLRETSSVKSTCIQGLSLIRADPRVILVFVAFDPYVVGLRRSPVAKDLEDPAASLLPDPAGVWRLKMALLTWLAGWRVDWSPGWPVAQSAISFFYIFFFVNLFIFLISLYKTNAQYFVKQYYTRFLYFRYF